MVHPRGSLLAATAGVSIVALLTGCSSGQDRFSQGSLSVRLVASRPFSPADPLLQMAAAKVTVSHVEARKSDGRWVSSECEPPATLDLVASEAEGVNLPSQLLPEGDYSALQLRFSRVELRLGGGEHLALTSPASGWVVRIPADFTVRTDRATAIALKLEPGASFTFGGGHVEFDPDVRFDGVLR